MLEIFIVKSTLYGMTKEPADIFIDIIFVHILNAKMLKNESFLASYRNRIHSYIEQLNWWRNSHCGEEVRQQFKDRLLRNTFPSDKILETLKWQASSFRKESEWEITKL